MKILYLTVPSFFDLEISLIRELRKFCDVHVLLIVSPESMRSSAFDINKLYSECKIINAREFDGMQKYRNLIALEYWNIANNPDNTIKSCLKLANQIKKFIKDEKFDLIHSTTDCKTSFFLLPFIKRFKYTLFTEHDPIPHRKMNFFREFFSYNLYFLCFRNILLLSNSLLDKFQDKYKRYFKKIYQSELSIYDFLREYPSLPIDYGDYILFWGRIDKYKGVDLLLNAYKETEAYKKGIKLIIAGRANIELNENDDHILIFNRYIPNEELATLISKSIFVVLPYRSATQSGCVFSAYAFYKPILATRVGDIPNHVNENTGWLISPNDEKEIVKGINHMMKADLIAKKNSIKNNYSENGEKSWEQIAQRLVKNVYTQIIFN